MMNIFIPVYGIEAPCIVVKDEQGNGIPSESSQTISGLRDNSVKFSRCPLIVQLGADGAFTFAIIPICGAWIPIAPSSTEKRSEQTYLHWAAPFGPAGAAGAPRGGYADFQAGGNPSQGHGGSRTMMAAI